MSRASRPKRERSFRATMISFYFRQKYAMFHVPIQGYRDQKNA
jgi:hypothetical protein